MYTYLYVQRKQVKYPDNKKTNLAFMDTFLCLSAKQIKGKFLYSAVSNPQDC